MSDTPVQHDFFTLRGFQRSGTNWCGAVLNLHPNINCRGEFHFDRLVAGLEWFHAGGRVGSDEPYRSLATEGVDRTIRGVLEAAAEHRPKSRWIGDRTPCRLFPMLGDAPHFVIERDGRDVIVSMVVHLVRLGRGTPEFLREMAPVIEAFKADPYYFETHPEAMLSNESLLRQFAQAWGRHIAADRAVAAQMEAGELPGRPYFVRYEKLHAEVDAERAKMYEHLHLNPAVAAAVSQDDKTAPGFDRKKDDPNSHYRAGRVADWKKYFHGDAGRWFHEEAGEQLLAHGFETDENWYSGLPEAGELSAVTEAATAGED